jgi:hypothetical protein
MVKCAICGVAPEKQFGVCSATVCLCAALAITAETRDAAQAEATKQTLMQRVMAEAITREIGQLRHAYQNAMSGYIGNPRDFAEGLLAPAIRGLEVVLTDVASRNVDQHAEFRVLASAMRKVLPSALLDEVIGYFDPLKPFVRALRGE